METPLKFRNVKNDYIVTAADRLRKLNDDGLAAFIVDYIIGVIDAVLIDTEYTVTHDRDNYIKILLQQLKLTTTELPHQYTPNELKTMTGDKIFIQHIGTCADFYQDLYAPYYGEQEVYVDMVMGQLTACKLPLEFYGKSWLAYAYRPLGIDVNLPSRQQSFRDESVEYLVNAMANINAKLHDGHISGEQHKKLTARKMDIITELTARIKAINKIFSTADLQNIKADIETQLVDSNLTEHQINALVGFQRIIEMELKARFENDPL